MVHVVRNRPYCDRLVPSMKNVRVDPIVKMGPLRMRVWLAKLQPKTQQPFLQLLGQPRARAKPANEKCELSPGD